MNRVMVTFRLSDTRDFFLRPAPPGGKLCKKRLIDKRSIHENMPR